MGLSLSFLSKVWTLIKGLCSKSSKPAISSTINVDHSPHVAVYNAGRDINLAPPPLPPAQSPSQQLRAELTDRGLDVDQFQRVLQALHDGHAQYVDESDYLCYPQDFFVKPLVKKGFSHTVNRYVNTYNLRQLSAKGRYALTLLSQD